MKLLAIGAHPDDIEIFMYGFIAQCFSRGDEIFLTIATDGTAGDLNTSQDLKLIRYNEAKEGLKKLGNPYFLNLPDGKLSACLEARSIIYNHISDINPDIIVTHAPEDYHPDHRALSLYVSEAASFKRPVILADTLMGVNFMPDIYVDISNFMNEKVNAILKHQSQKPENFVDAVKILNGFRSSQCNGPLNTYAEAYRTDKTFPFSDIRNLLPKAPPYRKYYTKESAGLI